MTIFVRTLTPDEIRRLEDLQRTADDPEIARRARIVLLSARRQPVYDISRSVQLHPINVRKWLHRFSEHGVNGLYARRSPGRPPVFSPKQRETIVHLAVAGVGGGKSCSWSLQRLRQYLIETGIVEDISAETIRQQLIRAGLEFRGRQWTRQH